jgi:PqqD family protein of HPr-rel-A system
MAPARYRPEPGMAVIVRPLEDITLIYHRRSGQTHLVVSPVPEILAVFADDGDARSVDETVADLSRLYDLGDPAEARAAIDAHLEELAALGLVHRI